MVKYAVHWSEAARNDLRDIHDYLLTVTSRVSTKKLIMDVRKSTRFLPEYPRMYQVFEGSVERARHIVVRSNWRVLYQVDDALRCCTILAVVHARRLPGSESTSDAP